MSLTDKDLKIARAVYGGVVGTGAIVASYNFGTVLIADGLTLTEAVFIGGVMGVGFVAAMPWIFMSWFIDALRAWRNKGEGE